MASKQSIRKKRQAPLIITLILTIGVIELQIISAFVRIFLETVRFIIRWFVSILCVLSGAGIAYLIFYFYIFLPSPTVLAQYQRTPSIAIFDSTGVLLYKEWNTQRNVVSSPEVSQYRKELPPKEYMAGYLASHIKNILTAKDRYWFQKKMEYLYSYNSIALIYMNAMIYQNGVVGAKDAAEVYFQKELKMLSREELKKLFQPQGVLQHKQLYARMSTETYAVRAYIEKVRYSKTTGWILIHTSLDVQLGTKMKYEALRNPKIDNVIMEGAIVRAWTMEHNELLAQKAILKTKEGGEYNE